MREESDRLGKSRASMNGATEKERDNEFPRLGKNNHPKLSERDRIKIDFRMLCY